MPEDSDTKAILEFIRRRSTFEAFEDQHLDKRELAEQLDVSRPTAHRIITSFLDQELIQETDNGYELTRYGSIIGEAVQTYHKEVVKATSLKSLLNELPDDIEFEYRLFADATVTEATYDDPFRPMSRFIELFEKTSRIKGFNKSFLEPMYIDIAHERIEAGLESDIIYDPKVIELVLEEYPNLATAALEQEHVSAAVHDDLPIAMVIFEDRIGIGVHSESMGAPLAWIDTDNPDAIAWGERLFEQYQSEATQLY